MSRREVGLIPETAVKRLFFALWPDEALRQKLYTLGGELLGDNRGRRIPPDNLHLTLAFLGRVDAEGRECLERAAAAIRSPAFTLVLDRVDYRPRQEMLWAGGGLPEKLLGLVAALHRGLAACGFKPEARPFQAHLTLARDVRRLHLERSHAIAPLTWDVAELALVASQTLPEGACYEVLRTWPLI